MIYLVIALSILVNISMLYYELGLGVFVSVLLQLSVIAFYLYQKNKLNFRAGVKLFITVLLIAPFILRDMLVFKTLTLLALPFIYTIFFIDFDHTRFIHYIPTIIDVTLRPLAKFHLFFKELLNKIFKGRDEVKYIITGIAITIPFLLIILPLLISSDLIIETVTLDFFDSLELSFSLIFRLIFILLFCSYWYGQFSYDQKKLTIKEHIKKTRSKQSIYITVTFLSMINLIYGLYVFIQVKYLFLNIGSLPDGITYATYAREGFFQLLTVTLINLALIIMIEYLNHSGILKQRLLESFTLLMTIIMSVSAFYRMSLYEQSYGYTTLRLLVFLFLIFLILIMVLLIVYILTYKELLLSVISVFTLIVYISVSWMNLDSYVAKANIERYEDTGDIDIHYLSSLSLDAKIQLLHLEETYPDLFKNTNYHDKINESINQNHQNTSWQEWNLYK